jgi:serine/threonine protein phosphatase PrpC
MSGKRDDTVEIEVPPLPPSNRPRPATARVGVEFGSATDRGKVRPTNEDHFLIAQGGRWFEPLADNLPDGDLLPRHEEIVYLMMVADGMGGMAAGEVASRMAITFCVKHVLSRPKWTMKITPEEIRGVTEQMVENLRRTDWKVTQKARGDPALAGMGTTFTGAYSVGADLFLAHVGDSRAYLFRAGRLRQLTHDQTVAQALADAGQIAQEDVARHRLSHVLSQAVGTGGGNLTAQTLHVHLEDGDRLLMCSDGLTNMVDDAAIADVLRRTGPPAEACQTLLQSALDHGGKDNVTLILARYAIPREADPTAASSA